MAPIGDEKRWFDTERKLLTLMCIDPILISNDEWNAGTIGGLEAAAGWKCTRAALRIRRRGQGHSIERFAGTCRRVPKKRDREVPYGMKGGESGMATKKAASKSKKASKAKAKKK